MWNFSNGQPLTDLYSKETGKKVDTETTALVCRHDPSLTGDELLDEMAHIISVGWSRKIHIWQDEKTEEVDSNKILPQNDQAIGHKDDIMSCVYGGIENGLIYTGAHDGTLIAWNFETGAGKYQLSDYDATCTSKKYVKDTKGIRLEDDKTVASTNPIKDSKSVDKLLVLDGRADPMQKKLLSMSADQLLRFWDMTDAKAPTFTYHCGHPKEDSLTAVAITKDNNTLITGDTSG